MLKAIWFPVICVLAEPPSTWTPKGPFPMAAPVVETPMRLPSIRVSRRAAEPMLLTRMPPTAEFPITLPCTSVSTGPSSMRTLGCDVSPFLV